MRVFVLCSGRCGSTTFARACSHITNFTSGHETQSGQYAGRLTYPDQHIEVDNRLAWMLGPLGDRYGDEPVYVHLQRNYEDVLDSYKRRTDSNWGILPAFAHGVIQSPECGDYEQATRLMLDTIRSNITQFLSDKSKVIRVRIEHPHEGLNRLWDLIGATGDRNAAHEELGRRYNARQAGRVHDGR